MEHVKMVCTRCILTTLCIIMASCTTAHKISGEYSSVDFRTECLGYDTNGTVRVRTWGKGADKKTAIENAKRNALEAILFQGITGSNSDTRPLVTAVNPRERFSHYFNQFFTKNGPYESFITVETKAGSYIKADDSMTQTWGVTAIINLTALETRLRNDNIIKY